MNKSYLLYFHVKIRSQSTRVHMFNKIAVLVFRFSICFPVQQGVIFFREEAPLPSIDASAIIMILGFRFSARSLIPTKSL